TARTTSPLRASRYAVTKSAAAPAIVTSSNRTSDTRAATYTASAAGSGRSHPAGTVASRQNAPISNAVGRLIPACTGGPDASSACTVDLAVRRMASSVTESSPSTAPSAAGPGSRPAESMSPLSPLVKADASHREVVLPSPARGTRPTPPSHQAASPKTAPWRDDCRVSRSLASSHGGNHRSYRAAQAVRACPRPRRYDVHRRTRAGHRVRRPERRGQVHHYANHP